MQPGKGMGPRTGRVLRYVTAFCPECHDEHPRQALEAVARLAGMLVEEDGRVWLVRGCPAHGRVRTYYDESAEILTYLEEWTAPTKMHVPDTPGNYHPVPAVYLRGLGEMQTQHTCILVEDIARTCNLSCPNCFAGSSPALDGLVPVDRVLANIDQRLARENGQIDVLMLSGGEPTLHPDLLVLLDQVMRRNIIRILINSNGIEIAQNDRLVEFLREYNSRIEVYLQFDGFRQETHRHHRSADLRRIKSVALERLSQAGVFTTLTMTAALGVNDDEIGDVIRLALDTPFAGGVSIQPQFSSGRSTPIDPTNRLTHTGVLSRLGPQTNGLVTWKDLTSLPCSHPHCCSVGYLLRGDAGEWRSLVGIIGHDRFKGNLGLVSNKIADREIPNQFRELVKQSLFGLLSEQSSLTHPAVTDMLRNICENCDLGLSTVLKIAGDAMLGRGNRLREMLATRVKRITVKPFMDMHTMIEERLLQCCVHVGTASETQHQCAPFCAVQAWPALRRMSLSEATGSETHLSMADTGAPA